MVCGKTTILLAMAMTALVCASVAYSQKGVGVPGSAGTLTQEEYKAMMEKYRQEQSKQNQAMLGATDEEWKVLEPKYDKVQTLKMQDQYGRKLVDYGAPKSDQPVPQTDVQKATAELTKVLENKDVKPDDIKSALENYRKAKAKIKEDLEKACKELKELLTVKQEAKLVLNGMLE